MRRSLLLGALPFASCVYGGSDEDPRAGLVPEQTVDVGMIDASIDLEEGDAAAPSKPARSDGGMASPSTMDAAKPHQPTASACEPPSAVAVCDPIRNMGCPPIPLMQCDADIAAAVPTGRCSIFTPTPIVPCSSTTTASSTACLPQTTCVEGACRKLCYCDADCDPGQTCSDVAGAFKLCK